MSTIEVTVPIDPSPRDPGFVERPDPGPHPHRSSGRTGARTPDPALAPSLDRALDPASDPARDPAPAASVEAVLEPELVRLVHRAMVQDAERLPAVVGDLGAWGRTAKVAALLRFFGRYDGQVHLHQRAVLEVYGPALRAQGAPGAAIEHVEAQHRQLADARHRMRTALQAAGDERVELADAKGRLVEAATTLARQVRTLVEIEELVLLPLYRQHISRSAHIRIQLQVRSLATFTQLEHMVPWLYDRLRPRLRHHELQRASELFKVLSRTGARSHREVAAVLDLPGWAG